MFIMLLININVEKTVTLMTTTINSLQSSNAKDFEEAKSAHANLMWHQLEKITVYEAAELWLSTLNPKTRINYQSGLHKL